MDPQTILKKFIEIAGGPRESGYILAIAGDNLRDVPTSLDTATAKYTVIRPASEIALRYALWQTRGAPVLALVDQALAHRLPPDIVRRSARNRVHAVEPAELLSLVLGVYVIPMDDPALERLAMDHVDELRSKIGERTLPTVVDRELLDELLLDVLVGGKMRRADAGSLLALWLTDPPSWPTAVTELVKRQLPRIFALEGTILAWAASDPIRLEALLVHGVLLALDEAELPQSTWGKLWKLWEPQGMTMDTFRRSVTSLVHEALDKLGDKAAVYLKKAETIARKTLQPAILARSNDLPLGLDSLAESVAQRAADGEAVSHAEIEKLRKHRFATAKTAEIDVLEEMTRLSRYLAEPESASGVEVRAHVRAYQRTGAFADWAATRLRGAIASSLTHQKQAQVVLSRHAERRDRDNRAFADLLRADYVKTLNADGIVPLHRLWQYAPARPTSESDRLYVVVLDGCSYPVFLRLLAELSNDASPMGLRVDSKTQEAAGVPALSPLPTITSHARGALFLGEIPNDPWIAETTWREEREAATDPARFKQNKALGNRKRRLFLKGDLGDHGQGLLTAIQDASFVVVAVVFNAVDDQIGSSNTGSVVKVGAKEITAFVPSLRAALESGRRVVITADHGHSPYLGKTLRSGEGSTPRYVPLGPSDKVPEGFLEIDDGKLGGVNPGRKAFAYRMGAYLGMPQVGFHGGCGLEEMVVPLAEIVSGGVAADEPAWWFGGVVVEERETASTAADIGKAAAPFVSKNAPAVRAPKPTQAKLFPPEREASLAAIVGRLGLPDGLRAQLDMSEQAALAIVYESKSVRVTDIATTLARPPGRVPGLMARLVNKLHAGGFACLRRHALPDGEEEYVYVPQGKETL